MSGFKKAVRENIWAKILLIAPSGGGKSYSALRVADGIKEAYIEKFKEDTRVAVLGTESSRDKYYANEFDYDLLQLSAPFTPEAYIGGIDQAIDAGYKILIIDGISPEWAGKGGCLEIHSKIPGNTYVAWGRVSPRHNKFMDKLIESELFIIATVRGEDKYVLEEVDGKSVPKKVALGYTQRKDTEYQFTSTFNIDQESHIASSVKDNTHIFEDSNDILTKKHGIAIFEWASGDDLDEKQKEIDKSIEEGKRLQAENEKAEAEELGKTKPKDVIEIPQPELEVEDTPTQEVEVDKKATLSEIREVYSALVKGGKKPAEVLKVMDENGTKKPTEETDGEVLIKILNALKEM